MADIVLCEVSNGIALVTLNRPQKLNALNYATVDTLLTLLDDFEADAAVRAVILTGAGDKAFSAGADISEFAGSIKAGPGPALRDFLRRGQRLTARIEAFPKPVIVAVNGLAYGGGCEVTEAAPLAIASRQATFAKPEIRLGLPPTFGGTQRLARLAGRKRAMEYILTAEPFSAERALELGLVNKIVEPERLLDEARLMASKILAMSPLAVEACMTAVTRGLNVSIDEGLAIEASQFARVLPTRDIIEGVDAFLEKRPPAFVGR